MCMPLVMFILLGLYIVTPFDEKVMPEAPADGCRVSHRHANVYEESDDKQNLDEYGFRRDVTGLRLKLVSVRQIVPQLTYGFKIACSICPSLSCRHRKRIHKSFDATGSVKLGPIQTIHTLNDSTDILCVVEIFDEERCRTGQEALQLVVWEKRLVLVAKLFKQTEEAKKAFFRIV